jgi:starvation-inducible DNA-binding protein
MIKIGIDTKNRETVAKHLNVLLANEFALYIKTLKYHWNVVGRDFGPLHKLFNDQYEELLEIADRVAERVRALDLQSFGTMKEFSKHATITEDPGVYPKDMGMIRKLVADHEIIIRQIRDDITLTSKLDDMGTNNFLCDLIEKHEKMAWMLRAHVE